MLAILWGGVLNKLNNHIAAILCFLSGSIVPECVWVYLSVCCLFFHAHIEVVICISLFCLCVLQWLFSCVQSLCLDWICVQTELSELTIQHITVACLLSLQDLGNKKENKTPVMSYCAVSSIESSHKSPVTDVQWLPKTFEVLRDWRAKGLEGINNCWELLFPPGAHEPTLSPSTRLLLFSVWIKGVFVWLHSNSLRKAIFRSQPP